VIDPKLLFAALAFWAIPILIAFALYYVGFNYFISTFLISSMVASGVYSYRYSSAGYWTLGFVVYWISLITCYAQFTPSDALKGLGYFTISIALFIPFFAGVLFCRFRDRHRSSNECPHNLSDWAE